MALVQILLLLGTLLLSICARIDLITILPLDDRQFLKAGENFSISCTLHGKIRNNKIIKQLTFLYGSDDNKTDLRSSTTKIVNELNSTTINLEIINPRREDGGNYYCCLRKKRKLCWKEVYFELKFGDAPAKPKLICTSYNIEKLVCDVDVVKSEEDLGGIPTTWNIAFKLNNNGAYQKCNDLKDIQNGLRCTINDFRPRTFHNFKVDAQNDIGSNSIQSRVDPLQIIKPNEAQKFHVDATESGIFLTWKSPLDCYEKSLRFYISYSTPFEKESAKHSPQNNRQAPVLNCHENFLIHQVQKNCRKKDKDETLSTMLNSSSLISGVLYDVSIFSKPEDGSGYFSEPVCIQVTTSVGVPLAAPVLSPWSYSLFCIKSQPTLAIYWMKIPIRLRGGKDIKEYNVSIGSQSILVGGEDLSAVLKVNDSRLCAHGNESVSIQAATEAGMSNTVSTIEVYSAIRVPSKPNNVEHQHDNSVMNVTWQLQRGSSPPDFTRVHWCYGYFLKSTQIVKCQNEINQTTLHNPNTNQFISDLLFSGTPTSCPNCDWRIAISMETDGISCGLIWERNPSTPTLKRISEFNSENNVVYVTVAAIAVILILVGVIVYCCRKFKFKMNVKLPVDKTQMHSKTRYTQNTMVNQALLTEPVASESNKNPKKPDLKDSGHHSSFKSSSKDRNSHISSNSEQHAPSDANLTRQVFSHGSGEFLTTNIDNETLLNRSMLCGNDDGRDLSTEEMQSNSNDTGDNHGPGLFETQDSSSCETSDEELSESDNDSNEDDDC